MKYKYKVSVRTDDIDYDIEMTCDIADLENRANTWVTVDIVFNCHYISDHLRGNYDVMHDDFVAVRSRSFQEVGFEELFLPGSERDAPTCKRGQQSHPIETIKQYFKPYNIKLNNSIFIL